MRVTLLRRRRPSRKAELETVFDTSEYRMMQDYIHEPKGPRAVNPRPRVAYGPVDYDIPRLLADIVESFREGSNSIIDLIAEAEKVAPILMGALPEEYRYRGWDHEDYQAKREGWKLYLHWTKDAAGNSIILNTIQAHTSRKFKTDTAALEFVRKQAAAGSKRHQAALDKHGTPR